MGRFFITPVVDDRTVEIIVILEKALFMKFALFILFFHLSVLSYGQKRHVVVAPGGLSVRSEPSPNGSVVGRLSFRDTVEILSLTNERFTVQDNHRSVAGRWVQIDNGYVFDGYLLPADTPTFNMRRRGKLSSRCESGECNMRVYADYFALFGYDYEGWSDRVGDTIRVFEELPMERGFGEDVVFQILPSNRVDSIRLDYYIRDRIAYFRTEKEPDMDWSEWNVIVNAEQWIGDYFVQQIPYAGDYFFDIPNMNSSDKLNTARDLRKNELGLRDTLVFDEASCAISEAHLVYNGRAATYTWMEYVVKVYLYIEGRVVIRYIIFYPGDC